MNDRHLFRLLLLTIPFSVGVIHAQKKMIISTQWSKIEEIPSNNNSSHNLGLAGAIVGADKNIMLIAGGSNFPGAKPWDGGKKVYHDAIYILKKQASSYNWERSISKKLMQPVAYCASVSTDKGIVCIGGENQSGILKDVFLLAWNESEHNISIHPLPSIPEALTNVSATSIGKKIFVVGGENEKQAVPNFMSIDLDAANPQWQILPALPTALSHTVSVTQSNGKEDCIYVIGGRAKTDSGISDLFSSVYCFRPSTNSWTILKPVQSDHQIIHISAASAIAFGSSYIIVTGCDDGAIFSKIEHLNYSITRTSNEVEKSELVKQKMNIILNHPGFNRSVLLYNTLTDTWSNIGEMPIAPVTTSAIKWDEEIFIATGEIRPGIRTPDVIKGQLIYK